MKPITFPAVLLAGLALAPTTVVASAPGPKGDDDVGARVDALIAEYDAAYKAWYDEYLAAGPDGAAKAMESIPDPAAFGPRLMEAAAAAPTSEAAFTACAWTLENVRGGDALPTAIAHLTEHFLEHPEVGRFVDMVHAAGDDVTNAFLRGVLETTDDTGVAARACYHLASGLRRHLDGLDPASPEAERLEAEVVALYERCASDEYASVALFGATVGEQARRDVFELQNLRPGKVAPDIEGEDIDGVSFRLSDSKGKVILLDFWGDW